MTRRAWIGLLLLGVLSGCGRPGLPVAPDDYGVGLRMQQERKKEAQARTEEDARAAAKQKTEEGIVIPPDEVTLPDMRPVGGR